MIFDSFCFFFFSLLKKEIDYGSAVDMWSLGVITYELLSGELPPSIYDTSTILEMVHDPEKGLFFAFLFFQTQNNTELCLLIDSFLIVLILFSIFLF